VVELRIRLNCFSSSGGGLEALGVVLPRLSSVARWSRLGVDSDCCIEEMDADGVCREKMENGRAGDASCVGSVGAGLDGGGILVLRAGNTDDASCVGKEGACLTGAGIPSPFAH
jgi:hypothetical protein